MLDRLRRDRLKHGAGFLTSGLIAFAVDALVLALLTKVAGLDPYSARLTAIAAAMVAGYFAHRNLTFRLSHPASLAEFAKFAAVATAASVINYALYAALLLIFSGLEPLIALTIASGLGMIVSYFGYRLGVFQRRGFKL